MGYVHWLKNIISLKKPKNKSRVKMESSSPEILSRPQLDSSKFGNQTSANGNGKNGPVGLIVKDKAATRIQTAFRAYKARKTMRNLKGMVRLKRQSQSHLLEKQTSITLNYVHSWSRIQAEIKARRMYMVTQGRIRQKNLENQLKLEAKLHDVEVEWNGGSETKEEILARIYMREEAAIKRERTLAYAFSHQWRANSSANFGPYEVGKADWGWSWTERWIAARPWEGRAVIHSSPKKLDKVGKNTKLPPVKSPLLVKSVSPNAKGINKGQKLSYGMVERMTKEQLVS